MAKQQTKLYALLVGLIVIAFIVVVLRSALQGEVWTIFLRGFLPKTRPVLLLPGWVQAILGAIVFITGMSLIVWAYKKTKPKKTS